MTETYESTNDFASSIILAVAGGNELRTESLSEAVARACESLRRRLEKIIGDEGSRAMLARSLVLVKREFPWLEPVQISADGMLNGLRDATLEHEYVAMEAGCVVLLAQFLGLLVNMVGEELTARLLADVWPNTPFRKSNVGVQEVDG